MVGAHPALKGLPTFGDYRELLDQVRLDGVLISTPHTLHFVQISECLERGLHVLAEKPLVVCSDHARKLIELRDKRRRVLLVAYQRHYQPAFRYLRRAIREGRLGRVHFIQGYQGEWWLKNNRGRWRTDPALSGGGVLADVMSHILEVILWLTDSEPEEVHAYFDQRGTPVEVNAVLSIRFKDGAIASVNMCGDIPSHYHDEVRVWGDRGGMQVVWDRGASVIEWMPEKRVVPEGEWPPGSDADRNFVNAVLGREPVEVPAEWGLKVTLLKEAAWESGRTGRAVKVAKP
jgi:predicted dehydrogenase